MSGTLGRAEQEQAFMGWLKKIAPRVLERRNGHYTLMLLAFSAGEKRGLELHGCCENEEPVDGTDA